MKLNNLNPKTAKEVIKRANIFVGKQTGFAVFVEYAKSSYKKVKSDHFAPMYFGVKLRRFS